MPGVNGVGYSLNYSKRDPTCIIINTGVPEIGEEDHGVLGLRLVIDYFIKCSANCISSLKTLNAIFKNLNGIAYLLELA